MLKHAIQIALAIELIFLAIEKLVPATSKWLPLGGDHFVQVAVLLFLAVAVGHLSTIFDQHGES